MNKMITKLVALLAVTAGAVAISIATMVYGYGVEVKSWPAIIGLGVFAQTFFQVVLRKVVDEK